MDIEQALISHVIENKSLDKAIDQQVKDSLFVADGKEVWTWMLGFYRDFGDTPSRSALEKVFPTFEYDEVGAENPLMYLIKEMRSRHISNLLKKGIRDAATQLKKKDPYEAVAELRAALLEADEDVRPSRDVSWTRNTEARIDQYEELKQVKGIDGLPTLWPTLNELTQGLHKEELWIVVGRQGLGKTWFLAVLAQAIWRQQHSPLLITKEMSVQQIVRRLDAAHFQLPYMDLRAGQLQTMTEIEWADQAKELEGSHDLWVSGDDAEGGVSGVAAKIDMYKPAVCMVDGAYFLTDERRGEGQWQKIDNIAKDLKGVARRAEIPLVASFQFSKRATNVKGKAEDIALADIAKHADVIVGIFQTSEQRENSEIEFRILKQREGPVGSWECVWNFETMEFYEIGDKTEGGRKTEEEAEAEEKFEEEQDEVIF